MTVVSQNVMIVESLAGSPFTEITSTTINVPDGMMLVEGVLGVANVKNRNNRYYTLEEYQRHISTFAQRIAEENGVFGEMEHPKSMNINLHNVSHKVMSVRIDENGNVIGQILLLDTPTGKIAQSIVRSGSPLPVSSRALGNVNPKTGETILEYLSTWDLVGTSGFKQATVRQISESLETETGMIVESVQIELNADNSICENQTEPSIHASQIKEIVEAYLAENAKPANEENDEDINEQMIDQLFATKYAPIIEEWMNTTYSSKFAAGLQTWLFESFAPQIQSWIVESFAPQIQSWVTEQFAPELGNSIQTWVTEEFATELGDAIQSWVTESYSAEVQKWVTEEFAPELGNSIENWLNESKVTTVVENSNENDDTNEDNNAGDAAKPSTDENDVNETLSAKHAFKSAILESIKEKVTAAAAIEKPQPIVESVDAAMFKTGPVWLRNIPSDFKASWAALNESQQEQIYKRAAIRVFETQNDIETFWKGINFHAIVEKAIEPTVLSRTIVNESAQPIDTTKNAIFAIAKKFAK